MLYNTKTHKNTPQNTVQEYSNVTLYVRYTDYRDEIIATATENLTSLYGILAKRLARKSFSEMIWAIFLCRVFVKP